MTYSYSESFDECETTIGTGEIWTYTSFSDILDDQHAFYCQGDGYETIVIAIITGVFQVRCCMAQVKE